MQGMKANDARFLISNEVADPAMMGIFENSFLLSNYENFLKKEADAEDNENDDEDFDIRSKKVRKSINKYEILTENSSNLDSSESHF